MNPITLTDMRNVSPGYSIIPPESNRGIGQARAAVHRVLITAMVLLAATAVESLGNVTHAQQISTIKIADFVETFSEMFRGHLDVTADGPSLWTAHTPWHGDFGDAVFADPQPDFPFRTGPNGLEIIARKGVDGRWQSGLLSSVDAKRHGFAQALGYFEARMRMPKGPGVWPAFWLVSNVDPEFSAEIDIVEYYGKFTGSYNTTAQIWPKTEQKKHRFVTQAISVPADSLWSEYHLYGVDVTDTFVIFYLDRKEVTRTLTLPSMKQPLSILLNLALGSGWPIDETPNPSILSVDYVKVFRHKN